MKSKKLKLDMYYDNYGDSEGYWFVECKILNLYSHGKVPEEALKTFAQHFSHFRKYYAKIPESKLMGKAIKLKKLFLKFFGETK